MRHFLLTIVIVLVIAMGLSSCLCQPRSVSFSHLCKKIRMRVDAKNKRRSAVLHKKD